MCNVVVCTPGCDIINFEINLIFLIKLFFLHDQKVNNKTFFIIFKGLSLQQIKQILLESESPTLSSCKSLT